MNDILAVLTAQRREDARRAEAKEGFDALLARARTAEPPRDFAAALRAPGRVRIIAELKKASPSKGIIRADFDPVSIARGYAAAGAAAISVLCEPRRFLGDAAYLAQVRQIVPQPLLFKDFLSTPYQIAAARAAGADAVLLIAAVLDAGELADNLAFARSLGMHALVETHDEAEITRALTAGARIVGVNCRDLRTFRTDPELSARLIAQLPGDVVRVAESGIRNAGDVRRLHECGADALLIGTTLMRAEDPALKLRELQGE